MTYVTKLLFLCVLMLLFVSCRAAPEKCGSTACCCSAADEMSCADACALRGLFACQNPACGCSEDPRHAKGATEGR